VISRANQQVTFPAKVQLVATMNPCPCGMLGDREQEGCICSPAHVQRYRSRISRPLLDRIDLHVEVPSLPLSELERAPHGESSAAVRERVLEARQRQARRYEGTAIRHNAELTPPMMREHCDLDDRAVSILTRANKRLHLSARGFDRVRKVARTIADLGKRDDIAPADVAEALSYRALDREIL
jgi:magnesium chelatase family protein